MLQVTNRHKLKGFFLQQRAESAHIREKSQLGHLKVNSRVTTMPFNPTIVVTETMVSIVIGILLTDIAPSCLRKAYRDLQY